MKYHFCFFILFFTQILRGSPSPIFRWSEKAVSLSGHLSILEDEKGDKTAAQVLNDSLAHLWQPYPTDYLQLGYPRNYIWLRLDIDFDEIPAEKLYWWFDMSTSQDIQFYHIEKDSVQKFVHTGINFPFGQRDVLNRLMVFSFKPNNKGKTILLGRFHSDVGSFVGYTYLHKVSDFAKIDRENTSLWVSVFTFMFFSALLTFGLWLVFRERIYAYYAAYLLCAMMLLISINGFGYEWFWRDSPTLANSTKVVWTYGSVGFLLVFVYRLLYEVVKGYSFLRSSIRFLTGVLVVVTLIALNYRAISPTLLPQLLYVGNWAILATLFFILFMLCMAIYKKFQPAYYFLAAFLPVVVTASILMLRNAGWFHNSSLQSSFITIPAFCIEIVLLFLALLKRFQTLLKNQQEKRQMELESQIRLQTERERISRDLHDNVGAQLSYIISNIDHIVETQNKDNNRLDDVADTAKNAILNLRETIWAINNEQITVEDFYDRFKLYATNQVKNRSDVRLVFNENIVHNHTLHPNQALNLYRICQEALTNALKYANAQTLDIFIRANDKPYFQFQLQDDGVGFDLMENTDGTSRDSREGGYGLKNMKARAHELGADFRLFSEKGKGTTIDIIIENQNLEQVK
jgi:two-component system, sensor histidine kinase LadS